MLLLLGFALLAGAGTALSPCVLPVLPALLASGGVGGRRRPLGVVIGLTVTFTVTIVGVADVVNGVGLGSDPLRDVAVAVLLASGLALIVPGLADRLEARMSRIAALGPRSGGEGFRSGLLVGGALGFVYTPCAGPILAAVISVSAASGRTVAVAIAYSLGSAAVLLALTLGGRSLFDRVRAAGRGPALQRTLGIVMVATAVAILGGADVSFDQYVAEHIPEVNLTSGIEKSRAVESRLPEIGGHKAKFAPGAKPKVAARNASEATLLADARGLKDIGEAPEFRETGRWFNTPGDRPLTLASLRGRVVLVDFWTYTCINCIRTLPYLKAWEATYGDKGLTIVGVHTPEFAFEHEASNVQERYLPLRVALSGGAGQQHGHLERLWQRVLARGLPDRRARTRALCGRGRGRLCADGDGDRASLAEAGTSVGGMSHPTDVVVPSEVATPETYLGTGRAQGWRSGPQQGVHDYGASAPARLGLNEFAFSGTWDIAEPTRDGGVRGGYRPRVRGQTRLLGVQLPRRNPAQDPGPARRPANPGVDGGRRRSRRRGDGHEPAPVLARVLARRPAASAQLALRSGVSGYAFTFG